MLHKEVSKKQMTYMDVRSVGCIRGYVPPKAAHSFVAKPFESRDRTYLVHNGELSHFMGVSSVTPKGSKHHGEQTKVCQYRQPIAWVFCPFVKHVDDSFFIFSPSGLCSEMKK